MTLSLSPGGSWASACPQDLENQMHIAEQKRRTLLKDFHDTWSDCNSPASPFPHLLPSTTVSQPCWLLSFCFEICFPPPSLVSYPLSLLDKMWQGDWNAPWYFPFFSTLYILIMFCLQSISFPAVKFVIVLQFDYRVRLWSSFKTVFRHWREHLNHLFFLSWTVCKSQGFYSLDIILVVLT